MNTIYMMIGIQGSGKTTYSNVLSKGLSIPVISSDIMRQEMPKIDPINGIFEEIYKRCAFLIEAQSDLIYDATNITPKVRKRFIDGLISHGIDMSKINLVAYYFEPDVELSKSRVDKRNKIEGELFLPLDVIDEYAKNIIEPTLDEGFNQIIKISKYYNKNAEI